MKSHKKYQFTGIEAAQFRAYFSFVHIHKKSNQINDQQYENVY